MEFFPNFLMSIFKLKPRSFFTASTGTGLALFMLPSRREFLQIHFSKGLIEKHEVFVMIEVEHLLSYLQQSRMIHMRASSIIALGEPPFNVSPMISSSLEISSLGDPSKISHTRSSTVICSPTVYCFH